MLKQYKHPNNLGLNCFGFLENGGKSLDYDQLTFVMINSILLSLPLTICYLVQEQYIFIHRVILTYLEEREKKESLLAGFSTLGGMSPLPKSHKAFKVGNSTDSVCEGGHV